MTELNQRTPYTLPHSRRHLSRIRAIVLPETILCPESNRRSFEPQKGACSGEREEVRNDKDLNILGQCMRTKRRTILYILCGLFKVEIHFKGNSHGSPRC